MKGMPFAIALGVAILIFGGIVAYNRLLAIGTGLVIAFIASVLYRTYLSAPECTSDEATIGVIKEISLKFPNKIFDEKNIHKVSGGFLSSHNECEMEITPMAKYGIRTTQTWTRITYSTSWSKPDGTVNVEAHVAGP